ncbi:GntR family transcriptional regulator [Neomoorella thermoacetica]|uniref:HTH-type transcriptional repressor YtrA n=1 Tax=Neomoorella thermoacetica TaxID=1525 RepID=A0A1J5PDN1_NEOTH|nr:GntR family transcriptional regulator [Moorella thermoacetica]OIQ09360.1 HTH-type transcriptional repressor YtrA [Moorella thermoacetica]OIQ61797.1 HTH-type transcriptional repressor YtrA [Moorella thermoacetica]
MEFDNSRPIYLQIIAAIKKQLARGELQPGQKLPSQREMAEELQVNPNTVQRAYREMEAMGLLETLRGQGTFISNRPGLLPEIKAELAGGILNHFIVEMRSLGLNAGEIISLVHQALDQEEEGKR